jgi:Transposase
MFVKQSKSWKGTLLTFTIGYRENGKVKHKNVETIGYLDELEKLYDNPISHFKAIAKERSNSEINELVIKNINSKIIDDNSPKKNLGYMVLKDLYNQLLFKDFFKHKQSVLNIEYNLNDIFQLLIFSRIMYPASKKETFENKSIFFEIFDFSLKDIYKSLDLFNDYKDDILTLIWNNTKDSYNRDTSVSYYDCTNYYFEISYNDEDLLDEEGNILEKGYRKKGPSKEHRKTPIVQMGLLMDNNGIPLTYDLFPGNESEKLQLRPTLKKAKSKFGIERTIVVADRGLNTSDNTVFIAGKNDDDRTNHDGYVYGQSILGADAEFKTFALNQDDYTNDFVYDENGKKLTYKETIRDNDGNILNIESKPVIFKHKSRVIAKSVTIKRDGNRISKYDIYQKQMVYYSRKYAIKQQRDREIVLTKARDLIANKSKYNKSTSYGAAAYVNNLTFVKSTGEIPDGLELSLNQTKIDEESKYDGYYSIVTSEKNLSDKEIRDIYKGLWKIEETFKITKSTLESRPVYVSTPEHIEAHFLTCFVSLVILRLLEKKLNNKYSPAKIIESLKSLTSTKVEHDIYLQDFRNEIIKDIESTLNIDMSKKYLTISQIKKMLN